MSPDHYCRRGRRCKTRTRNGTEYVAGMIEKPGLCSPCEQSGFDAIAQLDADWLRLDHALANVSKGNAPKIGGTNEHPIPLRLDAEALSTAIVVEVVRWARVVTRGNEDLPDHTGRCVARCVTILRTGTGTLIDQPRRTYSDLTPLPDGGDEVVRIDLDGVDAVMRLHDLHKNARHTMGDIETRIWLPDPCHVCGRKALSASKDQARITCQACRNVWSKEHFARLNDVLDYERRTLKGSTA